MAKKAKTEEEVVEEMFNNLVEGDEETAFETIEDEAIEEQEIEELVEETLEEIQEEEVGEEIIEPRQHFQLTHPRKALVFQPPIRYPIH